MVSTVAWSRTHAATPPAPRSATPARSRISRRRSQAGRVHIAPGSQNSEISTMPATITAAPIRRGGPGVVEGSAELRVPDDADRHERAGHEDERVEQLSGHPVPLAVPLAAAALAARARDEDHAHRHQQAAEPGHRLEARGLQAEQ